MKIIGGKLGGREIKAPSGKATHPMSERVRGALFNILGDVSGLSVLDAYAGSGALGLESLSRGASSALLIDKDFNAYKLLRENIESLGLSGRAKAVRANCVSWLKNNPRARFDLIFLDPPYDKLNLGDIEAFTKHLNPNGLMVLSFTGRESVPTVNGVVVVDSRLYGDAALAFYRQAP